MDRDTPALHLARLATAGDSLATFYDAFADILRTSFDGARLFIALNDTAAGRLVRAYGPDVELTNPDEEPRLAQALSEGKAIVDPDGAFFPLEVKPDIVGVAAVYKPNSVVLAQAEAQRIGEYMPYLALRIERERLRLRVGELESLAALDGLTGVLNRRSFDERLALEWNRAMRTGELLAVVMADIDYFKSFNDRYGHVAGDFCLRAVASALRESIGRASDTVARYGGEEFAVILPATELAGAIDVAEKMRASVNALSIPHDASSLGRLSVSVGVATMQPQPGISPTVLVEKADVALYEAKAAGRNRVVAENYASDALSAQPRHERHDNVPTPLTRFFGRIPEMIRIRALFDESRLVTLTGAGGVGKTRLAIAHATSVASHFEDGVWFIDLAACSDAQDVAPCIARALEVRETRGRPLADAVLERLRAASALLVFDNCEHLLDAAARTTEGILMHAPLCAVLATSREPLGVDGERVFRVPSLGRAEALELFSDRAAAAGTSAFRDEARRVAADVCERLDGIPMALELAAARLRSMSVAELARGLDDRFAVLTKGMRTALPRHKTLGALIDWSYASLTDEGRAIFDRLSVFAGSFSVEAVAAVCAPASAGAVAATLQRLFDKSLIDRVEGERAPRYRLLETFRAFAFERLQEAGGVFEAAQAHAMFFATLARASEASWSMTDPQTWRGHLRPERENFVQAMRWALELGNDPQTGGTLAAALSHMWVETGEEVGGLRWLELALDSRNGIDERTRAALYQARARLLAIVGQHADAELSARRAFELYTALGEPYGAAQARLFVGGIRTELGDAAEARVWLDAAREAFLAGGHDRDLASTLTALAHAAFSQGDYAGSCDFQLQALEVGRRAGYDSLVAVVLGNLGELIFRLGDREAALAYMHEALAAFRAIGATTYLARHLVNVANFAIEIGEPEGAREPLREGLAHFGDQPGSVYLANCLDLSARFGMDDAANAAALYAFTDGMHERVERKADSERLARRSDDKAALRAKLGETAWAAALARGAHLRTAQAIELALVLLERR